jgi:hypothetical protein
MNLHLRLVSFIYKHETLRLLEFFFCKLLAVHCRLRYLCKSELLVGSYREGLVYRSESTLAIFSADNHLLRMNSHCHLAPS